MFEESGLWVQNVLNHSKIINITEGHLQYMTM